MDVTLTDSTRNELCVLRAKIENDDAVVAGLHLRLDFEDSRGVLCLRIYC